MEVEVVVDVAVAAAAVFWSVRGCWVLDVEVFVVLGRFVGVWMGNV